MKFIALGEAVGKVKDNKEFGKEAIKGWENLSEKFEDAVMTRRLFSLNCGHADGVDGNLFPICMRPSEPPAHYVISFNKSR